MIVASVPKNLLSRPAKEIAGWALTTAEYACIDYHDAERAGESTDGFARETAILLQLVLAQIGMRPPHIPVNINSPILDLMVIRGHIREVLGWKNNGPKCRTDYRFFERSRN